MGTLPADVWNAVLVFCDVSTVCKLRAANSWFAAACIRDGVWGGHLQRRYLLSGGEAEVGAAFPMLTKYELFRALSALSVGHVPMMIMSHDGPEWSHCYRAEMMLSSQVKGTYCTAPGVTSVSLRLKARVPFLLSHIKAKGGGKRFTSPLRVFRVTLRSASRVLTVGPFVLDKDPAEEHVFQLPGPLLAQEVDIDLLSGKNPGDNIDTEYVELHGTSLQPDTALLLTRSSSSGSGLVHCPQRLTVCCCP